MEQPLDVEDSQRATRMVLEEEEEVEEEEEAILRTGPGSIKQPIEVASERPIRMVREEAILRSGAGTMKHPIEVASERVSRMVRVHREEDHLQEKSTIFVVSDVSFISDILQENTTYFDLILILCNIVSKPSFW